MPSPGARCGWLVCCALVISATVCWEAAGQTADPACKELAGILAQRGDGYRALQETPLQSPNQSVTSTVQFLDSQDCKIRSSFSSADAAAFSCEWAITDEPAAREKFLALRDMIKACRSDLAVNDELIDPDEPVMLFIVTNDDTYIAVGLVSQSDTDGPTQHRVGIDILSAQGFANWKALSGE